MNLWRPSRGSLVRLLAAAVIERGLLFVFKPFEVDTCVIFFLSSLMVVFLSTSQGLILFLFIDLFETASYWKVAFLFLIYCLILLFSHNNFLLSCPRSTFNRWYICSLLLLRFKSPNQLFNSFSRYFLNSLLEFLSAKVVLLF